MNLKRKNASMTGAYLYADGHLVTIYDQRVKVGDGWTNIEFAEIWERPFTARLDFTGRIVLHHYQAQAYLAVAALADQIECSIPSLESGSDNTKRRGLAVGSLVFHINGGYLDITTMSDGNCFGNPDNHNSICSNGYSYQPHTEESFEDVAKLSDWADHPITSIHRVSKPQVPEQAVA